jgi:hypothetical protein
MSPLAAYAGGWSEMNRPAYDFMVKQFSSPGDTKAWSLKHCRPRQCILTL